MQYIYEITIFFSQIMTYKVHLFHVSSVLQYVKYVDVFSTLSHMGYKNIL